MDSDNENRAWAPADPLGEALHFLRMSGTFYCRSEFSAPWGLALPPTSDWLSVHVVTAGHCWLEVGQGPPRQLQPGDLALVPHGKGHRLGSEPGAPAAELFDLPHEFVSERYSVLRHGGGGDAAHLVCAAVRFDHPAAQRLLQLLPELIVIDAAQTSRSEWLNSTLRFMASEARALRPGGDTVITRLADILVIQAIRTWMAQTPTAVGWLGALRDKHIGRALALIHRDPARPWTLASLASEVAMSRSAFAARFTQLVGEPAMQYAASWRMHVALMRLKEDDTPLADLANGLGYQSEAAFSRAFKRVMGISPGAARQRAGAGAAVAATFS